MPQAVPAGAMPVSVQTGVPEPQAMAAPVAHGLAEVQAVPGVQALQTPAVEQTRSVPQLAPGGCRLRSVHTATPLEHS